MDRPFSLSLSFLIFFVQKLKTVYFGYPISGLFAAYQFGFKKTVIGDKKDSAFLFEDKHKRSY